eukprot:jgi/Ulvmu1/6756/UM030_0092.1
MGADKETASALVPVTILTGYLGSGKTTMLNNILNDDSHKMKFAVIENEFGEVGIDEKVLSESVDEEVIEVMNGCICCTVRGDLVEALKRLYSKVETFNGVIIETTGLADPAPVVQTFFIDEDIQSKYKLDSVITLVDTKHIIPRLDEEKPEGVENEAVEQVAFADRIILNKVDLAANDGEVDAIEARLRKINPTAMVHRCSYSKVHPKDLLGIDAFSLDRVLDMDPEFLSPDQEHEHDPSVVSTACKIDGEVNIKMLSAWIRRLIEKEGQNLYRYKGVIAVAGEDEKFVFQGVGMLFSGTFDKAVWKPGEKRESRFVFIGKNLDLDYLKKTFAACRVNVNLRFPVGTAVQASVEGGWQNGKVLKHWDDGNAYRIKLDDGVECWAPVDIDFFVRAAA